MILLELHLTTRQMRQLCRVVYNWSPSDMDTPATMQDHQLLQNKLDDALTHCIHTTGPARLHAPRPPRIIPPKR